MIRTLDKLKYRLRDWLYYARLPREGSGMLHHLRGMVAPDRAAKLERAIASYRFSRFGPIRKRSLATIRRNANDSIWREQRIGWGRYSEQMGSPGLNRTVVLKSPGERGEKGVMLLAFEYNWLRLLAGIPDLRRLENDYDIIFSTSSSPTNYQMLALAVSSLAGTVFVQASNYDEIADIEAIHPRVKCLPVLPSDWIEPGLFAPRPCKERDIDILMVANWHPVKRHWHFFEALRAMDPRLRVVVVGQMADSFDIEFARQSAQLFGAPQEIEFHQSLPIDEVAELQCRSKVSTVFSRREGSCIAVSESFFANTPVALFADAHIGTRVYINPQTGVLLDRSRKVGPQLQEFLERADQFEPRTWAEKNISAAVSARKLNEFLRAHALAEGRPWTADLVTPCFRAQPTLRHNPEGERLRPAYHALHLEYPETFPADLFETSHR